MSRSKRNRLDRLNTRITTLRIYIANGHDLKLARQDAAKVQREGNGYSAPTYTQAYKFLKSIPREERVAYEREINAEGKALVASVERQRKALRSTDIPSNTVAEKKNRKQAKREAKGAAR